MSVTPRLFLVLESSTVTERINMQFPTDLRFPGSSSGIIQKYKHSQDLMPSYPLIDEIKRDDQRWNSGCVIQYYSINFQTNLCIN